MSEFIAYIRWQSIKTPALNRWKAASSASQAEGIVTHAADPVLGLPVAAPFDTKVRPQRVMDCIATELL